MKRNFLVLVLIVLLCGIQAEAQKIKYPKTVRDFFMELPGKYFSLDCCGDGISRQSKEKYLQEYIDVEDTANGFLSAGGDGAQDALTMALFKRPDGTYLIGVYTVGEGSLEDTPWTIFLSYKNGKWTDVSRSIIPNYNAEKYIYELPRNGTTVRVFQKEENSGMTMKDINKGKKLSDLAWANGRFATKR